MYFKMIKLLQMTWFIINFDLPSAMYGGRNEYIHRIGRTGRIGHQGLATSFYNDNDEDLAQDLVNVLLECECEIPEFLEHKKPQEGDGIQFDDDTDEEVVGEENGDTGAEGGFGGAEGAEPAAVAWGASADESADTAAADNAFKAEEGATVTAGAW